MPTTTCIAPLTDGTTLCGAPSTTTRIVEGLVCALCDEHAAELDAEEGPRVYTYTIFDADPNVSSGGALPDHEDVEIEADDADDALSEARERVARAAKECDRDSSYAAGDRLWVQVWDADGVPVRDASYTITEDDLGGPLLTVVDPDRDLSCVLDERVAGLSSEVIEYAGSAYIVTTGTGEISYGSDGGACAFAYDADDVRTWLTSTRADETLDYGDMCDALSASNDRDLAIYLAARHEYRLTEEGACVPVLSDAEYALVRAAVRAVS